MIELNKIILADNMDIMATIPDKQRDNGGHMETKVIFGVQQCYDMKASERINYPDFAISWGFETKEDAIKAIQKTLDYNNTNIYFKIFKKTVTIEIIANIK